MGSHCFKVPKLIQKPLSPNSSSHLEQTTDPQENHESPHFPISSTFPLNSSPRLGSFEDVRKVYEINPEILGKGSFSSVRKAVLIGDSYANQLNFSLKSVLFSTLDPHLQQLLAHELDILKEFQHPNIVKFFEAFQDQKFVHFLLEFLNGGDLLSYICSKSEGNLCEKEAKNLLFGVFSAVAFLHRKGVVHRDLKPENLLFRTSISGKKVLKLIDFGLSKKNEHLACMKTIVGSPYYIAPEILKKNGYDSSCDVWSLGVILYVVLYGNPPFFSENLMDLFNMIENSEVEFRKEREISGIAKDLLMKMLKKNPKERISMKEVLKHEFFKDIREENDEKCGFTEDLKKILMNLKENSEKFKEGSQILRHLLMEFGLQYLNEEESGIIDEYYHFFDKKNKGEISLRNFSKKTKELGLLWSDSEISKIFQDYYTVFNGNPFGKTLNYHVFSLDLLANMDEFLEKNVIKSSFSGNLLGKEWIIKGLKRKLMTFEEKELEKIEENELVKKLMGSFEELDERNGNERVRKEDFKHISIE